MGAPFSKHGDPLTQRQADVLAFMREHTAKQGTPPTLRAIGTRFGLNVNAARNHVLALLKKGYLRTRGEEGHTSRYVPVVPDGCCPACGQLVSHGK